MSRAAIVLGAGAAGLAAARQLHDGGWRVTVLEARGRIGGRIWTDRGFAEFPIELGAELVHGEGASTHRYLAAAGLAAPEVDRYGGLRWASGGPARPMAELPAAERELILALRSAYRDIAAGDWAGADLSLADYLRGRGFDGEAVAVADVLLAQTCCASVEGLSCADLARELRGDTAGGREFRVAAGYDALLAHLAEGLDIRLGQAARAVSWGGGGVRVLAERDLTGASAPVRSGYEEHAADACVITLPVSLLGAGALAFDPPLPEGKQAAIGAFRTEPATKLFYRFDRPLWDAGLAYMAQRGRYARWWTPGHHRPGAAVICAYLTAARAAEVDAMPEAEALAQGLAELAGLLGAPDAPERCLAARRVAWAADPLALGGYAHLPPGAAAARPALAAPLGPLHFAGEASAHHSNPQTVHGAIDSGLRAAEEILHHG